MGSQTCQSLFLLLVILVSAYSDVCPPRENTRPCLCFVYEGQITVRCDGDISLSRLRSGLSSLRNIKNIHLRLRNLRLSSLPSNFFEGLHIKELNLNDCKFTSLMDGSGPFLKGLEDSLELLQVAESLDNTRGNTSRHRQVLDLGHLRKLREISLHFNNITELSNDWFSKGPASLKKLYIGYNRIQKIGDKAFTNLNNLQVLFLKDINLESVQRSMMPSSPVQLDQLVLSFNNLTEIPDDLFLRMPSLKKIHLNHNKLTNLEQNAWLPVWSQLDILDLEGNPLNCDSHMAWMTDIKNPMEISGTCKYPKEKEGIPLSTFIKQSARK